MSQDCCASRPTIYDERAKPVLSVFFFKFLIKKELMFFFLQRVVRVVATRGGAFLFTIGKIKTKKGLCTIPKLKTKNITNESLPAPYVIDQCSRVDRTCG